MLFDTGPAHPVTLPNPDGTTTPAYHGLGVGMFPGLPQRWTAQPFTIQAHSRLRWIIPAGWWQTGADFQNFEYRIWRRTGTARPLPADLVAEGAVLKDGWDYDYRIPSSVSGDPVLWRIPVDVELEAGDYYLSVAAATPIAGGTSASPIWAQNPQVGPNDAGGPVHIEQSGSSVFWVSGSYPDPGFSAAWWVSRTSLSDPSYGPPTPDARNINSMSFALFGETFGLHVPQCGPSDFNGDGAAGLDDDIEAFFACLGGDCCAQSWLGGADFNFDGAAGLDDDIEAFFRVLGGGGCDPSEW